MMNMFELPSSSIMFGRHNFNHNHNTIADNNYHTKDSNLGETGGQLGKRKYRNRRHFLPHMIILAVGICFAFVELHLAMSSDSLVPETRVLAVASHVSAEIPIYCSTSLTSHQVVYGYVTDSIICEVTVPAGNDMPANIHPLAMWETQWRHSPCSRWAARWPH